jgi:hypothetical protein
VEANKAQNGDDYVQDHDTYSLQKSPYVRMFKGSSKQLWDQLQKRLISENPPDGEL